MTYQCPWIEIAYSDAPHGAIQTPSIQAKLPGIHSREGMSAERLLNEYLAWAEPNEDDTGEVTAELRCRAAVSVALRFLERNLWRQPKQDVVHEVVLAAVLDPKASEGELRKHAQNAVKRSQRDRGRYPVAPSRPSVFNGSVWLNGKALLPEDYTLRMDGLRRLPDVTKAWMAGFTQSEIADLLGVDQSTVSRMINQPDVYENVIPIAA
jgi:hypothetical protein